MCGIRAGPHSAQPQEPGHDAWRVTRLSRVRKAPRGKRRRQFLSLTKRPRKGRMKKQFSIARVSIRGGVLIWIQSVRRSLDSWECLSDLHSFNQRNPEDRQLRGLKGGRSSRRPRAPQAAWVCSPARDADTSHSSIPLFRGRSESLNLQVPLRELDGQQGSGCGMRPPRIGSVRASTKLSETCVSLTQ